MAFYYIKAGGTATGDAGRYATAQTGSFAALGAANYYDSITDANAATTAPAAGDEFRISDLHAESESNSIAIGIGGGIDNEFNIYSVSDTAIDQYSTGASVTTTGGSADANIDGNTNIFGLNFTLTDNLALGNTDRGVIEDSTITLTGGGDTIQLQGQSAYLMLRNTNIEHDNTGAAVFVGEGVFKMEGGAIGGGSASPDNAINTGTAGEATIELDGVDLSDVTSAIINGGSSSNSRGIDVKLRGCRMAAGTSFVSGDFTSEVNIYWPPIAAQHRQRLSINTINKCMPELLRVWQTYTETRPDHIRLVPMSAGEWLQGQQQVLAGLCHQEYQDLPSYLTPHLTLSGFISHQIQH